jgi:hypothetical protein
MWTELSSMVLSSGHEIVLLHDSRAGMHRRIFWDRSLHAPWRGFCDMYEWETTIRACVVLAFS